MVPSFIANWKRLWRRETEKVRGKEGMEAGIDGDGGRKDIREGKDRGYSGRSLDGERESQWEGNLRGDCSREGRGET